MNHMRDLPIHLIFKRGWWKNILFLLTIPTLVLSLLNCSRKENTNQTTRPVAIRVTRPVITNMENTLSYLGTVYAQQEIKVIARVQGTVINLPFTEGERAQKGNVVAQIDAPELRASVERLRADKTYWCQRYEADQRLVAANALPEEQLASSKRACQSATAALQEAQSRLAKAVEKAPFDGKILDLFAEPGQNLMPGQPILLLGEDRLEIQVEVVEEDLHRGIEVGIPVQIRSGKEKQALSQVAEISPITSGMTRTCTVAIPIPPLMATEFRKGASVEVNIILESASGIQAVPLNAVADRGNNPHIFLIQQDTARKQAVQLGIEKNGWIEVSFPWNGKDPVASSNLGSLEDGSPVFAVEMEEVKR